MSAATLKVGDNVSCSFGAGVLKGIREDGAHIVTLNNWALANGKSPVLYLNRASITSIDAAPSSSGYVSDIQVGQQVRCSFGVGVLKGIREDGAHIVTLDNWALANGKSPVLFLNRASVSLTESEAAVAVAPVSSDLAIGQKVRCSFGVGVLKGIREDGAHIVTLDNWALANGKSPVLFLNRASVSLTESEAAVAVAPVASDLVIGQKVRCSFGVGVLKGIRADGAHIVTLDSWALANGKSPVLYLNRASVSLTEAEAAIAVAASSDLVVGQKVRCSFGVGVLQGIRDDGAHIVTLDNWALANGKSPVLYLNRASVFLPEATLPTTPPPSPEAGATAGETVGAAAKAVKKKLTERLAEKCMIQ